MPEKKQELKNKMAKKKFKIDILAHDISNIFQIIGALYLFFYFAQVIRGSPLTIGIIFIIIGFVIKFFYVNYRKQ